MAKTEAEPIAEEIVPKINVSDFLKPRAAKKDINHAELQFMFDDADSFPVNRKDTYLGPNPSFWKKCSNMRNDLSEPEMDIEEIEVATKSLIQNDSLIPNQVTAVPEKKD